MPFVDIVRGRERNVIQIAARRPRSLRSVALLARAMANILAGFAEVLRGVSCTPGTGALTN
jgi:hypothetical protein